MATLVLTYHSISHGPAPLCIPPERLAADLDFLQGAGFEPARLEELAAALAARARLPRRRFVLTFDDGYRDFLDAALPILESRRLPATLFATAGGDRRLPGGELLLMSLDEIAEAAHRGVAVGGHSLHHPDLVRLDDPALEEELRACREILEARSGRPVTSFAYPFGRFDGRVREAVARHFSVACTTRLALARAGDDALALPRVDAFYLASRTLQRLLIAGAAELYLTPRRWLRRLRRAEERDARL